ncbi:GYF domain-containing protein [Rubinisphaera sp.]|uniref:GYF domain-containing protein n=1 Tax=Rubinisphaera sp. TaxID=2024857 RepID=UPI000C0D40F3|nr:GYF domain-containing protein [Rubinisphaera sp.]MBV08302.1 hypothetical protein [Rubinisphaera sp.]HCS51629.1 hypothetical protein [Planctomycetaceae bacterium]|tara:strand:+ start:11127 stop:12602 length:1476 start_codon:yes stop_codon:yes gene_type:complete
MDSENLSYRIRLRGKIRGPFSISQLRQMSSRGQFSKLHQVSEDGQNWKPATELSSIFSSKGGTTSKDSESVVTATNPVYDVEWYYVLDQQQLGPVTESQLIGQIRTGNVPGNALVWHKGLADWTEAREIFPESIPAGSKSGTAKSALIVLSIACLAVAIGYGIWSMQQGNDSSLASIIRPPGQIRSMDLTNNATQEQVGQAIGMVVCYAEILRKTGERHERPFGHGTCFMVTRDGYAITNRHVVKSHQEWVDASDEGRIIKLVETNTIPEDIDPQLLSQETRVIFNEIVKEKTPELISKITAHLNVYFDGKAYPAEVKYISKKYDMAVLKIENPPTQKTYFSLSSQHEPPQSTPVIALGYPGVSQMAVTDDEAALLSSKSNKSNFAEILFGNDDHMTSFKSSAFDFVQTPGEVSVVQKEAGDVYNVQHTAAIRQGNSGGPLVYRKGNSAGTVIGINTSFLIHEAPVFIAFPVAQMRDELEDAIGAGKLTWD